MNEVIMNVNQGCDLLEQEVEIAYDCETTGLSPWKDHIALMQFFGRRSQTPVLIRIKDGVVPTRVAKLFEDPNKLFIGHNVGQFDILFLGTHGVNWQVCKWYDTLIGEGLISTTGRRDVSRNLKSSIRRRLGKAIDKNIEHGSWGADVLTEEQIKYAAEDVIYIHGLMDEQRAKAESQGQTEALNMETELLKIVSEMTLNGLPLVRAKLNEWLDEQRVKIAESQAWCLNEFGPINMNSWQQKIKAATSKGVILPNTKAETLQELADYGEGYPAKLAQMFLDYAAPAQRLKMYGSGWQDMHIVDDWAHPRFWQVGTDTLRFSSSDPNFQQIPKDGRKIIGNVDGLTIVSSDFSQIEVRIAAEVANDTALIEILKSGDAHAGIASSIYGVPPDQITQDMRKKAKAATFTLLFGGSYERLYSYARGSGSDITEDEAYEIFTKFFNTFPGLRKMREQAFAMKGRRAVTIRFPNSSKRVLVGFNVTPTRILNTAVQGPAAIGMKYSLFEAKKNGIMQFIGSTVHDELVAAVPDRDVPEVSRLLEKSMIDGMHRAFPNMFVKMEVKSGSTWQS